MTKRIDLTVQGQRSTDVLPVESFHSAVKSLYVHVPFCFHKCHYCDFYSFVDTADRQGVFVDRLVDEQQSFVKHSGGRLHLSTIFVGGGTPSLLRPELWVRLLGEMHAAFDLSELDEFTVECNPETVTAELMAIFVSGGVTRVSIGAQSFNPAHLKTLERWHDPENVGRALELAAAAGIARRNIDLIFAIPGQTMDEWMSDLDRALALCVSRGDGGAPATDHLSCYSLTFEPNTAMTKRLEMGEFEPMDQDLEADMQRATLERLRAAGFERYEVSNYARPGAECRHNLVYWRQGEWLAAGPSASAHIAGWRWKNVPRLTDWLEGVARGGVSPVVDLEAPDPRRALRERLMMGLRLREGVDASDVLAAADGFGATLALERIARREIDSGRLARQGDRWILTDEGMFFADGIAAEMMAAVGE